MKLSPLSELQAPDYIEPLRAYRAWELRDMRLVSLNGVPWEAGQAMVAKCEYDSSHVSPEVECTCGIYAGKNLEHLCEISYAQRGIHGEVDLWGVVQECELGFRAQYAYPRYFVVPPWVLLGNFREAEARLAVLTGFNIDLYVANDTEVSRDMKKTMLKPKGGDFTREGVDCLTAGVQVVYESINKVANRQPSVGDRLALMSKNANGISIISEVNKEQVVALLFNTTYVIVPRRDVRWNSANYRFECRSTSVFTRKRIA